MRRIQLIPFSFSFVQLLMGWMWVVCDALQMFFQCPTVGRNQAGLPFFLPPGRTLLKNNKMQQVEVPSSQILSLRKNAKIN